jgi:hypothetical protein
MNAAGDAPGIFHIALQGWPTCTGPEPFATRPAVQGCPTCTPEIGLALGALAAEPGLAGAPAAELELAGALGAGVAAIVCDEVVLSVAQPAVSTNAAEAANHLFFMSYLPIDSNTRGDYSKNAAVHACRAALT